MAIARDTDSTEILISFIGGALIGDFLYHGWWGAIVGGIIGATLSPIYYFLKHKLS